MKKDVLKGVLISTAITLTVTLSAPAIAQTVGADIKFNLFRIKSTEKTIVDWGQPYILGDGREVPASIVYNGETYLHVDVAGEAYYGKFAWNGDSSTFTAVRYGYLSAHMDRTIKKEDASGNIWIYDIGYTNNRYYLLINDYERGYSRAYELAGPRAYEFTDDGVYFVKPVYMDSITHDVILTLVKLPYSSTHDNQDGEEIYTRRTTYRGGLASPVISNGVMYFIETWSGVSWFPQRSTFIAVDCAEPENEQQLFDYNEPSRYIEMDMVKDGYIYFQRASNPDSDDFNSIYYYKAKIGVNAEIIEMSSDEYNAVLEGR